MTLSLLNLPIFTPGCGGGGGGGFYPNIKHCNNIIRIYGKHFQHFKTTQGYFSVWKKVVVLPRYGAIFPNKEKKWLDYRCREAKEMLTLGRCYFLAGGGGMRTLGIDWASMMTMQPSLATMKTVIAYEQALHLRDIEWSNAWVPHGRRRGSKVRGKKVRAHSHVRLPLEIETLL